MVLPLEKIYQRINCQDYSLKDIALYFEKYDGYTLEIETEDRTIKVKILKSNLPHLLGLQHIFKNSSNKIFYRGYNGFKNIIDEKITWETIKEQVRLNKNYSIGIKMIEKRISYLIMFFNTIEKRCFLKELNKYKTLRNTLLKGNYILYKEVYDTNHLVYPMLSIKELYKNNYIIETFIVEDNNLLMERLKPIKIKSIKLIEPRRKKGGEFWRGNPKWKSEFK